MVLNCTKIFPFEIIKVQMKEIIRSDLETILSGLILIMIYTHFPDSHVVFASLLRIIETSKL